MRIWLVCMKLKFYAVALTATAGNDGTVDEILGNLIDPGNAGGNCGARCDTTVSKAAAAKLGHCSASGMDGGEVMQ